MSRSRKPRYRGIVRRLSHRLVAPMALKTCHIDKLEEFLLPMARPFAGAYTVKTATKVLGVNRQRVYQLIDSGALKAVQLVDADGDAIQVLISKQSVQDYLEYRKADGALPRPSYA